MRKQYHLWPTEDGFDAWDVERLVALTRHLPVTEVPLSSIFELDRDYWFAGSGERPTVRKVAEHARLINEVDTSFPIILGPDGRVMDGMHRVARALLDGRPAIAAVRFVTMPEPDHRGCDPADLSSGPGSEPPGD